MNPAKSEHENTPEEEEIVLPQKRVEFFNPWEERFKNDLTSDERSFDF